VLAADPARISRLAAGLAGLSGPGWLCVDELARRTSWRLTPIDFVADWRPFLATDASVAGVVAASMCRDGRIREAAVQVLSGLRDPVASAALAVRVADWVPEVADLARAAVSVRTGPVEAAVIVPVCLALGKRFRGRQPAARYMADVAGGSVGTLEALAGGGDRACTYRKLTVLAMPACSPRVCWSGHRPSSPGDELRIGSTGRRCASAPLWDGYTADCELCALCAGGPATSAPY
jgi:hypothetical protein